MTQIIQIHIDYYIIDNQSYDFVLLIFICENLFNLCHLCAFKTASMTL